MNEEGGQESDRESQNACDRERRAPRGNCQDVSRQYRHGQTAEIVPHHGEAHGAALRVGEPQPDEPARRQHVHPGEREELKKAQGVEMPKLGHHGPQHQAHAEYGQCTREQRPRPVVVHEPSEQGRGQAADGPEGQRSGNGSAAPPERLFEGFDVQPESVVARAD